MTPAWQRRLRRQPDDAAGALDPLKDLRVSFLSALSAQHYLEGELDRLKECRDQVTALLRGSREPADDYVLDALVANLEFRNGEYDAAVILYERAIADVRRRRDLIVKRKADQWESARLTFLTTTLSILGNNLAMALVERGELETALSTVQEAVGLEQGEWTLLYDTMAYVHGKREEWSLAEAAIANAYHAATDMRREEYELRLGHLAWPRSAAARQRRDVDGAALALAEGVERFANAGEKRWVGKAEHELATVLDAAGRHDEACAHLGRSHRAYAEAEDLESAADLAERHGDALARSNRQGEAIDAYRTGLEHSEHLGDDAKAPEEQPRLSQQARLKARIALLSDLLEDPGPKPVVGGAVDLWRRAGYENPYERLVTTAVSLLADHSRRQLLRACLEALLVSRPDDGLLIHRALLALFAMGGDAISDDFRADERPEALGLVQAVSPLAVELDEALIPDGDDSPLLRTHIPALRARLHNRFGIELPGVRVRSNDLAELRDRYIILVNEVPLVMAELRPGHDFLVGAAVAGTDAVLDGTDPLTGAPISWVPEGGAAGDGDRHPMLAYVTRHLESVTTAKLADFLDHDSVARLLRPLPHDLTAAIFDETELLADLVLVLRALLQERVPITELGTIVRRFVELREQGMSRARIVAEIRLLSTVRAHLWGNEPTFTVCTVEEAFESRLARYVIPADGIDLLAMEPADAQSALNTIRSVLASTERAVMLVRSREVRPHVRRLIELEWPDTPVLSFEELLPGLGRFAGPLIGEPRIPAVGTP